MNHKKSLFAYYVTAAADVKPSGQNTPGELDATASEAKKPLVVRLSLSAASSLNFRSAR
jgi:hypothetical protein